MKSESIPWRRLFAEATAIILSILAAFSIDAWWDLRGDGREEREVLIGLRAEFGAVAETLEGLASFNATKADLVNRALTQEIGSLSDAAVDSLISSLPFVNVRDRGGGTLDALLSSGRLELVRDRDLRVSLARWPDRMEDLHTNDLSLREYVWGSMLPHMAAYGVPDGQCLESELFCVHSSGAPSSYRRLLGEQTFRSMLVLPQVALPCIASDHREASDTAKALVQRIDGLLGN